MLNSASDSHMKPVHSWAIYVLRASPAMLVGIVGAPDAETARAKAIKTYAIPPNQRGRLLAQRYQRSLCLSPGCL